MQNEDRKLAEFKMIRDWYGDCDWDERALSWIRLYALPLPEGIWNKPSTELLLLIPDQYPMVPPSHFYLDSDLLDYRGNPPAHFHHINPHQDKGWAYYCLTFEDDWMPSFDMCRADNLIRIIDRIRIGLS